MLRLIIIIIKHLFDRKILWIGYIDKKVIAQLYIPGTRNAAGFQFFYGIEHKSPFQNCTMLKSGNNNKRIFSTELFRK